MGIWYRAGTISVANGSATVTGLLTTWLVYVRPGDGISFDGGTKWYEVLSVDSNTQITLAENFAETTISGGSYVIDNRSYRHQIETEILETLRQTLAGQTQVIETSGPPSSTIGADKSIAFDPDARAYYHKSGGSWGDAISLGGADGVDAGFQFAFDGSVSMADPGLGKFRFNNATFGSITAIAIDDASNDIGNPDVSAYVTTWGASTSSIKGTLIVRKVGSSAFRVFAVTGLTDNAGWSQLAVTPVAAGGTINAADQCAAAFIRTGDKGSAGADGANAGFLMTLDRATTTMVDPGPGKIKFNNASFNSVTALAISDLSSDSGNPDVSAFILAWINSTNTVKGQMRIAKVGAPQNFVIFDLTGLTDNSGWTQLALTFRAAGGTLGTDDVCAVTFAQAGNVGLSGWTPVFSNVSDGARRVLQVIDWTGGTGTKPVTGKYVGSTGLVDAIGDGIDIRGAQGLTGNAGQNFSPNATGSFVGRSVYDAQTAGFSYLSTDGDGSTITTAVLFFKNSATSGDWSAPTPFQGPPGTTDYNDLANKPTLATVATSGSYGDLSNRPTLGTAAALNADTDGTLSASSDTKIATQKAVKSYVDNRFALNAVIFGADPTGTNDSVSAIQAAIDAAASLSDGNTATVRIPSTPKGSTYKISVPLIWKPNVNIVCPGVRILATAPMEAMLETGTGTTNRLRGCSLFGGIWDGNYLAQRGIWLKDANGVSLDNYIIKSIGPYTDGISENLSAYLQMGDTAQFTTCFEIYNTNFKYTRELTSAPASFCPANNHGIYSNNGCSDSHMTNGTIAGARHAITGQQAYWIVDKVHAWADPATGGAMETAFHCTDFGGASYVNCEAGSYTDDPAFLFESNAGEVPFTIIGNKVVREAGTDNSSYAFGCGLTAKLNIGGGNLVTCDSSHRYAADVGGTVANITGGPIANRNVVTPLLNGTWLPDGSNTKPSYSFASDPDTGLYKSAANATGIAAGGTLVGHYDSTGVYSKVGIFEADRSGAPASYNYFRFDNHGSAAIIGRSDFFGTDSGAHTTNYVRMQVTATDNTDGSEDGELDFLTFVAGAQVQSLGIANGVTVGSPTGGFKGTGSLNAANVYDDNVLLTCMALSKEFIETKTVDTDKWDAFVPQTVIPARKEIAQVLEEVVIESEEHEETDHGVIRRMRKEKKMRPAVDLIPVYDEKGNGIGAIERMVTEEITIAAQTIPRRHDLAHAFKAMIESGFDPRDPEQYFARMLADEALPGMPTRKEWKHNQLSTGELFCRKWLATEMLAIVCCAMWAKVKSHDERIAALES